MNRIEMINAVDLCCGAGGWACAARGLPIKWVAVADMAADCLGTWRTNFEAKHPKCQRLQVDLSDPLGVEAVLDACKRKRIDLIVGGIPCEQVSIARSNTPADEEVMTRWRALLDNVLSLVGALEPRWWCVEDVIHIERHLPPPLELGWDVPVTRINAADFGPQSRPRTFLGVFPKPQPSRSAATLGDCLRPGPHMVEPDIERYEWTHCGDRDASRIGNTHVRVLRWGDKCPTIVGSTHRGSRQRRMFHVPTIDDPTQCRLLSWQEAAMVQGFPEDFLFAAPMTRTVKMIGQAIPIQVGRAILEGVVAQSENSQLRT